MDNKTFENYQKRMLNAMSTPNFKSKDPFTGLSKILNNLKEYVSNNSFSSVEFRQEIEKQFKTDSSSDATAAHFKSTLLKCSNKIEALKTITDVYSMVKPISLQVSSWSSVASIANECMTEIEKSIYNSK